MSGVSLISLLHLNAVEPFLLLEKDDFFWQ